jgi:predicted DsbA family dithiol-disulfide isomerase
MAIFTASMEEGQDVADPEVLADIAVKCGVMSREDALAFLESDELAKEVEDMSNAARAKGITGVPVVVIDGKWAVSGGQSSEVYVQVRASFVIFS